MKEKSIREFGGEINAELSYRGESPLGDGSIKGLDHKLIGQVVDLIMAVLARHDGAKVFNDRDIPVEPLPEWKFDGPPER